MAVGRGTGVYSYIFNGKQCEANRQRLFLRVIKFQIRCTLAVSDTLLQGCYNVASFMSAISYVIIVFNRRDAY